MHNQAQMQPSAGRERRQFTRKQLNIEIFLAAEGECAKSGPQQVTISDMSLGGMCVEGEMLLLNTTEQVCLCFSPEKLNCAPEHLIRAEVIYAEPGRAGLRFSYVGVAVLRDIHRLLHQERFF